MVDVIQLVSRKTSVDKYGDQVIEKTSRTVFCRIKSISGKEFYQAYAVGLKPEISFILSDCLDYGNESLVIYGEREYNVMRTYRSGQEIELVCYCGVNAN